MGHGAPSALALRALPYTVNPLRTLRSLVLVGRVKRCDTHQSAVGTGETPQPILPPWR